MFLFSPFSLRPAFERLFAQREEELQAAAFAVARRDGAAVHLYGIAYDAEAEARAACFARAAFADAVEAFEEARQVLLGNARARVVVAEIVCLGFVAIALQEDFRLSARIANGVLYQNYLEKKCAAVLFLEHFIYII